MTSKAKATKEGASSDRYLAESGLAHIEASARTAAHFPRWEEDKRDLESSVVALQDICAKVRAHDFSDARDLLTAQALALDAMFNESARCASKKMGDYAPDVEPYLRQALKAQAQCRANVMALFTLSKPLPPPAAARAKPGLGQ
jgi:hypothetical protein